MQPGRSARPSGCWRLCGETGSLTRSGEICSSPSSTSLPPPPLSLLHLTDGLKPAGCCSAPPSRPEGPLTPAHTCPARPAGLYDVGPLHLCPSASPSSTRLHPPVPPSQPPTMPAGMKPLEKFLKKQTTALTRAGGFVGGVADKASGGTGASRRRASLSRVVPFFRETSPESGQAREVFR